MKPKLSTTLLPAIATTTEDDQDDDDDDDDNNGTTLNSTTTRENEKEEAKQEQESCTPPSIDDYAPDVFSQRQRRFGAVLLHVAFAAYLVVCVTRVCDAYFLSSLEIISERLNLDQDVAGATFMAAGSSAPEVFISLMGVFMSKSDAGIGSIVGSAVFNILFVIGICGLFIANVGNAHNLILELKKIENYK